MSSHSYANSTSSTTSLVSHKEPRDYSAAFGALASSYGSSGAAPCRSPSKTASHLASSTESSSKHLRSVPPRPSALSDSHASVVASSDKYMVPRSQDFGALMDKYGASMPMGSGQTGF